MLDCFVSSSQFWFCVPTHPNLIFVSATQLPEWVLAVYVSANHGYVYISFGSVFSFMLWQLCAYGLQTRLEKVRASPWKYSVGSRCLGQRSLARQRLAAIWIGKLSVMWTWHDKTNLNFSLVCRNMKCEIVILVTGLCSLQSSTSSCILKLFYGEGMRKWRLLILISMVV